MGTGPQVFANFEKITFFGKFLIKISTFTVEVDFGNT
jgi:hypothetical protein